MRAKKTLIWLSSAVGAFAVFVFMWAEMYPSPADPKSIQYVLWKADIYRVEAYKSDNSAVSEAMVLDRHRDDLILGKSEQELSKRFGRLARPDEMSPEFRDFAHDARWKGMKIRYIKGTAWLIAFDHEKAVDLLLVKG